MQNLIIRDLIPYTLVRLTKDVGLKLRLTNNFYWLAIVAGVLLFSLSIFLWRVAVAQEDQHVQSLVLNESKNLVLAIQQAMNRQAEILKLIAKHWDQQGGMSKQQWIKYVTAVRGGNSEIQAIEWVDKNYVVRWIVPLPGNEAAQDLNLAFEERRKIALEAAKNSKAISMSKVVNLVQGGKGMLLYYPLFVKGEFNGFILGVFRISNMLTPILAPEIKTGFGIILHDESELIYTSHIDLLHKQNLWGRSKEFYIFGKSWHLTVWPMSKLLGTLQTKFPMLTLISGMAFSLLATILLIMLGILKNSQLQIKRKTSEVNLMYRVTSLLNNADSFETALQQSINLICVMSRWPVGHVYVMA